MKITGLLATLALALLYPLGAAAGAEVRLVPQRGHSGSVVSAAFPENGRLFATAGTDGTVRLWSTDTGALHAVLDGYEGGVLSVRRGGGWLLAGPEAAEMSGAESGGLRLTSQLWDVRTGRLLLGAEMIALADDDRVAAVAIPNGSAMPMTIRLVEPATGRVVRDLAWREAAVTFLAISDDGALVAAGGERSAEIWDAATGRRVRTVRLPAGVSGREARFAAGGEAFAAAVEGAAVWTDLASGRTESFPTTDYELCADGRLLVTRPDEERTTVRDMATGRVLAELPGAMFETAFDPSGRTLALASTYHRTVEIWDATSWTSLWSRSGGFLRGYVADGGRVAVATADAVELVLTADGAAAGRFAMPAESGFARGAWVSPSGALVAAASARAGAVLWDGASGALLRTVETGAQWARSGAVSPEGATLAVAHTGSVQLWDLKAGLPTRRVTPPAVAAGGQVEFDRLRFDPAGRSLAIGTSDGRVLYDLEQERFVERPERDAVDYSPDGRLFVRRGEAGPELCDAATGTVVRAYGDEYTAPAVFAPDGRTLYLHRLVGGPRPAIERLSLETGRATGRLESGEGPFVEAAVSPDGRWLAAVYAKGPRRLFVALYDTATGRRVARLEPSSREAWREGTYDLPGLVAFSPDGATLAAGNVDGAVELWDVRSRRLRAVLRGHTGPAWAAEFTPDGRTLFTCSTDATARAWSVATGELLCTLVTTEDGEWIAAAPDGRFDGSPGGWSRILWVSADDVFDASPAEVFFADLFAPGLLADVVAGRAGEGVRAVSERDRRQPRVAVRLAEGGAGGGDIRLVVEVAEAPPGGGRAAGSGARDVRLFRDGVLVRAWRGDVLGGRPSAELVAEGIQVPGGESVFTAYAFNADNVKSADATLRHAAPARGRKGTLYVIAAGVDRHTNPEFDLRFAVADARAFGEALAKRHRAADEYAEVVVAPLFDADVTARNLGAAFARLAGGGELPEGAPRSLGRLGRARPEDGVIVYFAGHGVARGDRFYLVPHDVGYAGPRAGMDGAALDRLVERAVSDRDLERALEPIDAGTTLLVIDACQSGQALEASERRRGPMNSRGLAQLAYEKGMYVLTAAQSFQAALEAERLGHGYLTYALVVEGLDGRGADRAPRDGVVTLREWVEFAVARVPAMQAERLRGARKLALAASAAAGATHERPEAGAQQHPRAFFRREADPRPVVVARFGT